MTNAVLDALTSRVRAIHRWPNGPGDDSTNTAEHLLHALAASLTASIRHLADEPTEIETTLEGETDVRGALGLADDLATGFTRLRVTVRSDAPLDAIVDAALARSAVIDMVADGVPIDVVTAR